MMGRLPDDFGQRQLWISAGKVLKLDHASGSDIQGIRPTSKLNSLLPTEWSMYADDDLQDLFLHRMTSHTLQSFRYKSEIAKPAHELRPVTAHEKGPMIVCIDASSSMSGKPIQCAKAALTRVLYEALSQHRACFAIIFSVDIQTFDIRSNMSELTNCLEALNKGGGTSATAMLTAIFDLLSSDEHYMNADVLWISDFLIPLPDQSLLDKLTMFRGYGTRFYGLQIGYKIENEWKPIFDEIT